MPPQSYVTTALVLGVLVVLSVPLTLGFALIFWYWLFAAAACILIVGGVIQIALGLHAAPWIGVCLASPGILWAAGRLMGMMSHVPATVSLALHMAFSLSLLAAGAGALRLVETMSAPRAAFRVGYGLLALSALLVSVGLIAHTMGWTFTAKAPYATSAWAVGIAAALVTYGAFIAAAALITVRRDIEVWAGGTIGLISAALFYVTLMSIIGVVPDGGLFWLLPIPMLVGGAALWRMGSVLRSQARVAQYAQG